MEFATFVFVFLAISFVCELPVQAQPEVWLTDPPLKATHFWDCSGAACDATTLQPWDATKYRYSPMYAPLNPKDYGGSKYGEQMWMTGAANDHLSDLMGADAACCGKDASKPGGCGKCLLLRNPAAVNADWTVLVMKKNRCPPHSHGCGPGKAHFDLAVPGFDNLQYSTANTCGDPNTYITKDQSDTCGSWYTSASDTTKSSCCDGLPEATPEQKTMKAGCKLFASWGWKSGDPGGLQYRAVECPAKFEQLIGDAFGAGGLAAVQPPRGTVTGTTVSSGGASPSPPPSAPPTSGAPCECRSSGSCGCGWATQNICSTNDNSRCNIECCCRFRCSAKNSVTAPATTKANAPATTKANAPATKANAPVTEVNAPATTKANAPATTKANAPATTKATEEVADDEAANYCICVFTVLVTAFLQLC